MNGLEDRWLDILKHPTRVLVMGASGSGKSATAHRLAELLSRARRVPIHVYGVDPRKQSLYPPHVRHVGQGEPLPENAILLIDEAALEGPARRSMRAANVELANLAFTARHKSLTTIAVTQAGFELDRILVESAEVIVVKKPRPHQAETDRLHLRPLLKEAEEAFNALAPSEDPRGWAHVEHPGGREMIRTRLPSWWTENLSHIRADYVLNEIHPRRLSREKRKRLARELRGRGWSYAQIGRELKVVKSTAWHYVNGYPVAPTARGDAVEEVKRVGGASLTLHLPLGVQDTLLHDAEERSEEWAAPLYRDGAGRIFVGGASTILEMLSTRSGNRLVGFVASERLSPPALKMWLETCAAGAVWPGPKVDILARPNTLELRTWPPGARWYSLVLDKSGGDPDRLEVVARQRPTREILSPTPLVIHPNGTVKERELPEAEASLRRARALNEALERLSAVGA